MERGGGGGGGKRTVAISRSKMGSDILNASLVPAESFDV